MKSAILLFFSLFIPVAAIADAPTRVPVTLHGKAGLKKFRLEYADTPNEMMRGLMFRDHLTANGGMYFAYRPAQSAYMWMRDTHIPLDMLFIDDRHVIVHIVRRARPLDETPVGTPLPVIAVLELSGGTVDALGLAVGDPIDFKEPAQHADAR